MAVGTWTVHGPIVRAALQGSVDLDANANLYWLFTTSAYVPNVDHEFESSLTNVINGTNLPSSGVPATGSTVSYDAATNTVRFTVNDLTRNPVSANGIRNAHLVDKTGGSAATNRLIASLRFNEDISPNDGPLTLDIPATGVFWIKV